MSFFGKLFGKKSSDTPANLKPTIATVKNPVAPSNAVTETNKKENATAASSKPEAFAYIPDDISLNKSIAGKMRIDVILGLAAFTKDDLYKQEALLYDLITDQGLINVPLVICKGGNRYGFFVFYHEEEAKNYKKFKSILLQEGFADVYYLSSIDPEQYSESDGEVEKGVSFSGIFRLEKDNVEQEFENHYAMWWKRVEDPYFHLSKVAMYYEDIASALAGYEHIFTGMLVCGLTGKDFEPMVLPEESKLLPVIGPMNRKCLIELSKEKGFLFLFPKQEEDPKYAEKVLSVIVNSLQFLKDGIQQKGFDAFPEGKLSNSKSWLMQLKAETSKPYSMVNEVYAITIGNPPAPQYEEAGLSKDRVFVRLKAHLGKGEEDPNAQQVTIPEEATPLSQHFCENLYVYFALDIGNGYEFISPIHLKKSAFSQEELFEAGLANVKAEIADQIKIAGDPQTGCVLVTCGGNHESALLLLDDLWNSIADVIQSDVCICLPTRDVLLAGNFYLPEALDQMRDAIQRLYYKPETMAKQSNHIYLRKDGAWKTVEIV